MHKVHKDRLIPSIMNVLEEYPEAFAVDMDNALVLNEEEFYDSFKKKEKQYLFRNTPFLVFPYDGAEITVRFTEKNATHICLFNGIRDVIDIFFEYTPNVKLVNFLSIKGFCSLFSRYAIFSENIADYIRFVFITQIDPLYLKIVVTNSGTNISTEINYTKQRT